MADAENGRGYWWQCVNNPQHREENFRELAADGVVAFFYDLHKAKWAPQRHRRPCHRCDDADNMRVAFGFPRKKGKVGRLLLHQAVGLEPVPSDENYLPMMWASHPEGEAELVFDFKYVKTGRWQGLARPAVFSRNELRALIERYRLVAEDPGFLFGS